MNLQSISASASPEVPANNNFVTLSAGGVFGRKPSTSGGLTWGYYGCDDYNGNAIADGTLTLTDNSDNYIVVLRSTGVVSASTATTHSTDPLYARLYKVTMASGLVSAIVDERWKVNGLLLTPSVSAAGDVVGPASATDGHIPQFDGTTGKLLKDGLALDIDGTLAANSDTKVSSQKAVKTYVDAKVAGLSWKQAVRAATTVAGTLATSFENGDAIDGVTLATGDRILVKNQASGSENGIYVVAASGAPARATDADSGAELVNASVYVSEGTALADTQWTCTTNATITVGSTSLAFAQLTSGGGVSSVDASGGVETASGSAITGTGTVRGAQKINAQTGTTYAIASTDRGKHVTLSNASSIAATIAQAGTTGFEDGYFAVIENIGAGAVTITPTTSTINGAATLVLTGGMAATIYSDGTNYRAIVLDAAGVTVNAQTGTSYTYLSGDRRKLITHTNASAIAGTLPQATGVFGAGWFIWVQNRGAGTLTITPTTSTIDGSATLALTTGQGCLVVSDGTNYYTMRGVGGAGGGSTQGKHAIWVPAGAIRPSATGGCAALNSIASAANQPDIVSLDHDTTTQEYHQFILALPKSWNAGTITGQPVWSHNGGAGFGVVWSLQATAVSDGDTIAAAYGTAQTSSDTGGTTNLQYVGPETSAITIAGTPAKSDVVYFRGSRVTGDAGDTLSVDARLHGWIVFITTDADNDA